MIPDDEFKRRLEKLDHLYEAYAAIFYGEIKRNLYAQNVCDNILVEIYKKIWESLPLLNESNDGSFAWCYRIVCQEISKKKVDLAFTELLGCVHPIKQVA